MHERLNSYADFLDQPHVQGNRPDPVARHRPASTAAGPGSRPARHAAAGRRHAARRGAGARPAQPGDPGGARLYRRRDRRPARQRHRRDDKVETCRRRPSWSAPWASSAVTSSSGWWRRATGRSSACRAGRRRTGRAIGTSPSTCSISTTWPAKLKDLRDVTHIFYAAFQAGTGNAAGYASVIAPNRDMLVNSVTAIAKASREPAARRAGHRHQILRHASRPAEDADARDRSAPHAARFLLRPDRLADRLPARQARGAGRSCGPRRCAASRPARR